MVTPACEILIDVLNDDEIEISLEIPDELYDRLMAIPAPRAVPTLAVVTPFPRREEKRRAQSPSLVALLPIALLGVGLWLTWSAWRRNN